jgi:hypothetical protein
VEDFVGTESQRRLPCLTTVSGGSPRLARGSRAL